MPNRKARAWILNFDAEEELARSAPYVPAQRRPEAMQRAMKAFAAHLPSQDRVLDTLSVTNDMSFDTGVAWCPTPSALKRLSDANLRPHLSTDARILRIANERQFAYELGSNLPHSACVTALDDALTLLRASPVARWIVKRGLACAGRGNRFIDAHAMTDADQAFLRASLKRGALYMEPRVQIHEEFGRHGYLHARGGLTVGRVVRQFTNQQGGWEYAELAEHGALQRREADVLTQTFERVAKALRSLGYTGPFGIDAFRYHSAKGYAFQPLSEVNARFSMAWPLGMAGFDALDAPD